MLVKLTVATINLWQKEMLQCSTRSAGTPATANSHRLLLRGRIDMQAQQAWKYLARD